MCEKKLDKSSRYCEDVGGAAGRMPLNKITHFLEALR